MSVANLKAAATGQVAHKLPSTIAGLLSDPKVKSQMALALPKHVSAERLARIALTEVRKNPLLAKADQASFLGAIMQCAQLGIEPGGALGHAYLLPFENRRKNITEVQFILGYKGMLDLARRSGQILSIEARAVYAADRFHVALGLNPDLTHEPDWEADDRGEIRFVYAVAKLKDGGTQFEVMSRKEIERIRNESNGYKTAVKYSRTDSPWISAFEEMAKKTVIRRLFKYLPVSIEFARATSMDEQSETGQSQDNLLDDVMMPTTIDSDTGEITGGQPAGDAKTATAPAGESDGPTYAHILDLMLKAKTLDAIDAAADLISGIADQAQHKELSAKYDALRAELGS